ncbi:AtpZ/AtpI family protein [Meridianimarinicoccus sp. RP-17]|uniref:AtpZ/AtpI family protein n=1 Tax=Meridianimarinicoccus zhengii TaxID=2056810 RepID=UPI000DAD9128|nr:AtpZ/AtpI family protein [Phycocomes zhengii]
MTGPDDGDGGDRLKELDARIARVRKARAPDTPHQEEHYSKAQQGWRMVSELVAGLVIGFGIGYGLDVLLGTTPILLVLFTLLGFAAGVRVMMRTAAEFTARPQAGDGTGRDDRGSDADR